MNRKEMLKTQTLVSEDENPVAVICLGHVSEKQFNEAFQSEGWSNPGDYSFEDEHNPLRHEYWIVSEDESVPCKKSTKDDLRAEPVTAVNWD